MCRYIPDNLLATRAQFFNLILAATDDPKYDLSQGMKYFFYEVSWGLVRQVKCNAALTHSLILQCRVGALRHCMGALRHCILHCCLHAL